MTPKPIVIVTEPYDPHTDSMIVLLRKMGQSVVRLHPEDIPLHTGFNAYYDGTRWATTLQLPHRTLGMDDVRSIWWRRPQAPQFPETLTPVQRRFARDETRHAVNGMWDALAQTCYWVSFPDNLRRASHKLGQLQQATRLGLQVPRTLVSNDPDQVRQFYEICGRQMIYKVLYDPAPEQPKGSIETKRWRAEMLAEIEARGELAEDVEIPARAIYTTLIQEEHLAQLDTLRLAPGFFEEYIPKQVELRVTVIGNEVFAAELHSQLHKETQIDWRHYEVETTTLEHHLPPVIAEQCLALTRAYGLNFSTSDLILTPDGRYVFLEMNPNGQWMWVQERVPSLKMREALAACLIRGSNG